MILWRNWGGWHALNVFFFSFRAGSLQKYRVCISSMHVAFTLMRGNLKSDTESLKRFRIALKRKMTIENTRQQGIEVSYFYYKIY